MAPSLELASWPGKAPAPGLRIAPIQYNERWSQGVESAMAHTVFCVRNKKEMEGLDEPPFDSEFGQKIYKNVSKAAWDEWLGRQKMLLNEYRLQPWNWACRSRRSRSPNFGPTSMISTSRRPRSTSGGCGTT